MVYLCTLSSGESAQASFNKQKFRFTLRALIMANDHTDMQCFECGASSAEDLAFWVNLPEALLVNPFLFPFLVVLEHDWNACLSYQQASRLSDPALLRRLGGLNENLKRLEQCVHEKREEQRRLLRERLERLVRDRLQQRLEQIREDNRSVHDRLKQMAQDLMRQEREQERNQPVKQMQYRMEQRVQHELEQAIQLSLAELSIPLLLQSAPLLADGDVEQLLPARAPKDDPNNDCLVCYDGVRDTVCVPCGHIAMCVDCADLVKRTSSKCLLCNTSIKNIMKIFHA